ncbi:MAG: hypothetical protein ABI199_00180 [Bacteroidia bacterium]
MKNTLSISDSFVKTYTAGFRFGFNGKEKDNEVYGAGNAYTTEFRELDTRLGGRWWSLDPKGKAWESPYVGFGDNPILYNDANGDIIYFAKGTSSQFKIQFATTIKYLNQHGAAGVIAKLEASKVPVYIQESTSISSGTEAEGGDKFTPDKAKGGNGKNTILWNAHAGVLTTKGHILSAASGLSHEADHAYEYATHPEKYTKDATTGDAKYTTKEERRVITGSEQNVALKLGEIKKGEETRTDHSGTYQYMAGPTTTQSEFGTGATVNGTNKDYGLSQYITPNKAPTAKSSDKGSSYAPLK